MKELLFEIYTEEIPPFEQYKAAEFIKEQTELFFKDNQIEFESGEIFFTPRRVAYYSKAVSDSQPDRVEQVFGPYKNSAFDADGNPTKALLGFLKNKNKTLDDIEYQIDSKGERIFFNDNISGRAIETLLQELFEKILLTKIPFEKSMKWASHSYTFSRPIHSLLVSFDNKIVPIKYHNLVASNKTLGHFILNPVEITIDNSSEYIQKLKDFQVIALPEERKSMILSQMDDLKSKYGISPVIDDELLTEQVNIVEYPTPFVGEFDKKYLNLPSELLISTMKKHQKYFYAVDENGELSNHFIGIANVVKISPEIIHGNERVLKARLEDAEFYYKEDLKRGLEPLCKKLDSVLFQKALGSYGDKVRRVADIAKSLNNMLDFQLENTLIDKSSPFMKADLLTGMVLEFPELQGIAGAHYALKTGLGEEIADAIKNHYQPKTVQDSVPDKPLSLVFSLADKLDTLVGGFIAGLAPTGGKDAFGLRRISLGILKILVESRYQFPIERYFEEALKAFKKEDSQLVEKLVLFFKERVKFYLRNSFEADVVDSATVNTTVINADIITLCKDITEFKKEEFSNQLLFSVKRISNILKDKLFSDLPEFSESVLKENEEKELYSWYKEHLQLLTEYTKQKQYSLFLKGALSGFDVLERFFDKILVNDPDETIKNNRQSLLKMIYLLLNSVASLDQLVISKK
ncbi:glycine--tRNA ligase subunit beta [bacterium]|nr:glycine--tRNA ligase subunit beta [bacterium]